MNWRLKAVVMLAGGIALLVLAALAGASVLEGPPGETITAYFAEATGVYAGSGVQVLGVSVGTIDSVQPQGDKVKVTLTVNHGVDVPADASAVVIAPSVVSDRYIQLTPAYVAGPKMTAHAVIPVTRTATPMEIDKLYDSLKKISTDLGPNGANRNGAVSDALNTGARMLDGNGQDIRTTIDQLGQAAKTLTNSSSDLFATIDNIQKFTTMLKNSDGQVRLAQQQLADVTSFLAGDRQELGDALTQLGNALTKVKSFIQDNRALIKDNLDKLASITQIVVNQRASVAEALDALPIDVGNALNAYDPATGTLRGRASMPELANPQPPLPLPAVGGTR